MCSVTYDILYVTPTTYESAMKTFIVGGFVRDTLLGCSSTSPDIDYVVVGSTPQEMINAGFTPVGASFPVFLKDGEEYALARTERKTGVGYHGFSVECDSNITLEDDLLRRDLTINSMAMDMITGEIIDPYGGRADLTHKLIRHTSDAFAEDPVRVLRAARFAARYNFTIHPDTMLLMSSVAHELQHVPQDRILKEFSKSISDNAMARMCYWLKAAGVDTSEQMALYDIADVALMLDPQEPMAYWSVLLRSIVSQGCRGPHISSHIWKHVHAVIEHCTALSEYVSLSPSDKLKIHATFNTRQSSKFILEVCDTVRAIYSIHVDVAAIMSDAEKLAALNLADAAKACPATHTIKDWMMHIQQTALS